MLSLHTGYDTAYLTDAVGAGAAATDYYAAAKGEPPGYWQGAGARALGLEGLVDADVLRRLYHEDIGPDGEVLVRRQRPGNYPAAGGSLHKRIEAAVAARVAELGRFAMPEEIRAIQLKERAKFRTVVPFYDYTFSARRSRCRCCGPRSWPRRPKRTPQGTKRRRSGWRSRPLRCAAR